MTDLVDAARRYMGVKFRHRGRSKYSLDCAGLPLRAYADCGVDLPDLKHYGREPVNDGLLAAVTRALGEPVHVAPVTLAQVQDGDVILIRYALYPHHILIVGTTPYGAPSVIHTDGHYGKVIEHRLDEKLAADITHVFRRPV